MKTITILLLCFATACGSTSEDSTPDAPDAACNVSEYTQTLCYGTATPDSGTSYDIHTTCDTSKCHMRLNVFDDTATVWCCP